MTKTLVFKNNTLFFSFLVVHVASPPLGFFFESELIFRQVGQDLNLKISSPRCGIFIQKKFRDTNSNDLESTSLLSKVKFTLPETNISPEKTLLKMIFLFQRWDMLVPWRVYLRSTIFKKIMVAMVQILQLSWLFFSRWEPWAGQHSVWWDENLLKSYKAKL